DEQGYGIALDSATNAWITGYTASTNFPTQFATKFAFDMTNIVVVTNKVGTNFVVSTNTVITTNIINGTNFINGAKFAGTNDAFLAEIVLWPPMPTNIMITPPGATNGVGANVSFQVSGNGAGTPVLFQWQREAITNGIDSGVFTNLLNKPPFGGVTGNLLSITNIQTNDTGTYQVIIYSGATPITNSILLDVVTVPLIITPPMDQTNV